MVMYERTGICHSIGVDRSVWISQVLYGVNQRLRTEDVDSPLVTVRPVKTVLVAAVTGDRGLCGGYNNFIIKKVHNPTLVISFPHCH